MAQEHRWFEELYRANAAPLLDFAVRRVGDPALAEDLVEQTMLTAWGKIGELMAHPEPRRWLYRTLLNMISTERQKKRYRMELQLIDDELPALESAFDPGLLEVLPPALGPEDREILTDRWERRMDFDQIGEKWGLTTEAAKKRCQRALRRCGALLWKDRKGGEGREGD